jgi:hypothetical protein
LHLRPAVEEISRVLIPRIELVVTATAHQLVDIDFTRGIGVVQEGVAAASTVEGVVA